MIENALREAEGLVSGPAGAAAKLGVPRQTLESKIRKPESTGISSRPRSFPWPSGLPLFSSLLLSLRRHRQSFA